jgi:carboxypeptidase Taq
LHILIRFELEQALIDGSLKVADLPSAWSDKYADYLGIRPPDDTQGVLQDVHWSAGLVGYFPTYTLGNIFAAQLYRAAGEQLGDLDGMFSRGEFRPLLDWLRDHVHRYGRCYEPTRLIERATGVPMSSKPLVDYLQAKVNAVYGA